MHILELDLPEIPFSLLDNIEYWLFEKAYQCRARERGVKKSSRKLKSASHQCNLAAL
ncbi:hypothetical protein [Kaarinaea lacus]